FLVQRSPCGPLIPYTTLFRSDWFNAELDVRFGSRRVSLSQIHQAVRNKSRYLRLDDGTRGVLPEEWLERFRDYFSMGEIQRDQIDRKSTRLNSSHVKISYAVF